MHHSLLENNLINNVSKVERPFFTTSLKNESHIKLNLAV